MHHYTTQQFQSAILVGIVAGLLVLIAPGEAMAQRVLHVPSEYPTIQEGIDAAQTNDTVLVAPGNYKGSGFFNLDFRGKAITVRGENGNVWIEDIDGGRNGVQFVSGEGPDSVLDGINFYLERGVGLRIENSNPTITNCRFDGLDGTGLLLSNSGSILRNLQVSSQYNFSLNDSKITGGAPTLERVSIYGAPLTIVDSDVTLTDCSVDRAYGSNTRQEGGGMHVSRSTVILTRCRLSNNLVGRDYEFGAYGGGIYIEDSDARLVDCLIDNNSAFGHLDSGSGGGAFVAGGSVTFDKCVFRGNRADSHGGGVSAPAGTVFTSCTFEDNEVSGYKSAKRGGGAIGGGRFIRCTFTGNFADATLDFGGEGGGLYISSGSVIDSLFYANVAAGGRDPKTPKGLGAGLYAGRGVTVRGSTFVSNSTIGRGSALYLADATTTAANCIVWGNSDEQIAGSGTISWSSVQGNNPGEGNIDADPRFVDPANGDYRLGDGSPCIDAGSNALVPPESEFDLDGNPRFVNDPGMPDMGEGTAPIVDMGCYEFQSSSTGPNLRVRASCPTGGPARIGWANASPDRTAVLLISPGTGTIRIPNRYPCAGTELGLASSGLRLAWQGRNDAGGGRVINTAAPPGACGQFVQLLDVSTCNVSEVVQVE